MGNRSFGLCFARQGVSMCGAPSIGLFGGLERIPVCPIGSGLSRVQVERPGAKE
jgi:hypothetical protein